MQVDQRRRGDTRRSDLHAGTGNRIEHPCRHHGDDARRCLDEDEPTGDALFAVMPSDTPPIERVPSVVDLNFRRDMGRMTGRSP
jgi:hypothetical protein